MERIKKLRHWTVLVWLACWGCSTAPPRVDVVVGSTAPELERFAAQELCDYLAKLYGIRTHPSRHLTIGAEAVFLIGSPETNSAVRQALGESGFGEVTDQGLVLKRTQWKERPALVVGGGSPRATLWAVYDLVERWGVRYLTDRDVLPEQKKELRLPDPGRADGAGLPHSRPSHDSGFRLQRGSLGDRRFPGAPSISWPR